MPITDFSTDAYYKILSASHTNEGNYRCIASNKVGAILSEQIRVTVACKLLVFLFLHYIYDDIRKILLFIYHYVNL